MFNIFRKIKKGSGEPRPFFFHTDIHSHVCPGIDDGAADATYGAILVGEMAALGIRKMIVTPHITDEVFPNSAATIKAAFDDLQRAMKAKGVQMKMDYSAEHRIDDLLINNLKHGNVRPLPNDYILVENPWMQEPFGLSVFLRNLVEVYGLKPVLAHPERYPYYIKEPDNYARLHHSGVRFQINILSLAGYYGHSIREIAEMLLAHDMVEFIGTDLHHSRHVESIKNYLASPAYDKLLNHSHQILNDKIFGDSE